ncbi:uncharacterized protein [Melanerpes formicivorus]|uniref:uncharacterized protein isoform X2 n=1 Tax=Melanerpes formicivorus TaxID=211600 RepID=UPI00358E3473
MAPKLVCSRQQEGSRPHGVVAEVAEAAKPDRVCLSPGCLTPCHPDFLCRPVPRDGKLGVYNSEVKLMRYEQEKSIAYFWESLQENKYARWHITLHKAGKGSVCSRHMMTARTSCRPLVNISTLVLPTKLSQFQIPLHPAWATERSDLEQGCRMNNKLKWDCPDLILCANTPITSLRLTGCKKNTKAEVCSKK